MTELKDVLTPLVTLAGVWLGARFTLRNELSKKALEIRTGPNSKASPKTATTR